MAKVYLLVQPPVRRDGTAPDLTPLAEHGEVVTVLGSGVDPRYVPQSALDLARRRLEAYDPARDHVAYAGGDVLGVLLAGVLLAGVPGFSWLRWERAVLPDGSRSSNQGSYTPVWVALAQENTVHDAG